jgi:hypothetical protein
MQSTPGLRNTFRPPHSKTTQYSQTSFCTLFVCHFLSSFLLYYFLSSFVIEKKSESHNSLFLSKDERCWSIFWQNNYLLQIFNVESMLSLTLHWCVNSSLDGRVWSSLNKDWTSHHNFDKLQLNNSKSKNNWFNPWIDNIQIHFWIVVSRTPSFTIESTLQRILSYIWT